jgi:CRP/FNR family cyclic AMP-dependent transcriptional regulator
MTMIFQEDITTTLETIPWFRDLDAAQIKRLAQISHMVYLDAGQELFREGELFHQDERGDNIYIIINGKVTLDIIVPLHGRLIVFKAEPLDVLGWSCMTPVVRQRTASAVAIEASSVLVIDGDGIQKICEEDHDIGYIVMKRLANVVASHYLTARIQLCDLIAKISQSKSMATIE